MQSSDRTDLIIYDNIKTGSTWRSIAKTLRSWLSVHKRPQFVSHRAVRERAITRGWWPVPPGGLPPFTHAKHHKEARQMRTHQNGKVVMVYRPKVLKNGKVRLMPPCDHRIGKLKTIHANPTAHAVLSLDIKQCRFPIGEPGSDDFRFCKNHAVMDESYCRRHLIRCMPRLDETAAASQGTETPPPPK